MLPSLTPLTVSPYYPPYVASTLPRLSRPGETPEWQSDCLTVWHCDTVTLWQCDHVTVPGPDSSSPDLAQWTPRKLDKQRSVTFASLDPLEPIEEDFPQVRAIVRLWEASELSSRVFDSEGGLWLIIRYHQESRVWGARGFSPVSCTFVWILW